MARRSHGRVFTRPAPRTTMWTGNRLAATTISAGATLLTIFNAAALALRPFTIIRVRIVISYTSDQAAVSESQQGVLSQQVVTESAADAGIASLPTPLTEPDADYHVYAPIFQDIVFLSSVGVLENVGGGSVTVVDSKSMRKVGIDDQCVTVLEQQSALGTVIAIEGRTLIKLH